MLNVRRPNYEEDAEAFPAEAYKVHGHEGVAWYVRGWETERVIPEPWQDEETGEWYEPDFDDAEDVRTGRVVAVMVGDDRKFTFDPEDIEPLDRADYCGVCGQIGCGHDGYDREGDDDA